MSLLKDKLPTMREPTRVNAYQWDAPADLLGSWAKVSPPASMTNANTIDIFDVIGEDFWGDGVGSAAIAKALEEMQGDIVVRINSPGGDMFEGLAIYNLLLAHEGRVEAQVLGLAASAASVIAMAADEIVMGPGSFMMIHNAWGLVIGNRHDMRGAADVFEKFDGSMAKLYAARTGRTTEDMASLMDEETWLDADAAIEAKLADRKEDALEAVAKMKRRDADDITARRRLEAALAKDGVPRKERPGIIARALNGAAPRDASGPDDAERDAGILTPEQLTELQDILKT